MNNLIVLNLIMIESFPLSATGSTEAESGVWASIAQEHDAQLTSLKYTSLPFICILLCNGF